MNQKKVTKLIGEIKAKLAELENELSHGVEVEITEDKKYLRQRYKIITKKETIGSKKGLTKIEVFENIISMEAPNKTLDQLNSIFDKSQFPTLGGFASYNYIVGELELKHATDDLLRKYSKKGFITKDKKNIRVLNQWASFENIQKQTPGNFPVLEQIAKTLGYEIIATNKE